MVNPFDDPATDFRALRNELGQYSLWPVTMDRPAGWEAVFGPASRAACLDHIEQAWTSLSPVGPAPGESA
ncbi:MbtH family protein [Kribbella sp. NPDC051620]|uniref:MbtH family protein n=1 Tax=Kribbella sp. NPDC051620 TaxID=3364120 RepID=UPI0037A79642